MADKDNSEPRPVGLIITQDYLKGTGLTVSTLAKKLKISMKEMLKILEGTTSINEPIAIRLSVVFHNTPDFWLYLQRRYDEHRLRENMDKGKQYDR